MTAACRTLSARCSSTPQTSLMSVPPPYGRYSPERQLPVVVYANETAIHLCTGFGSITRYRVSPKTACPDRARGAKLRSTCERTICESRGDSDYSAHDATRQRARRGIHREDQHHEPRRAGAPTPAGPELPRGYRD